MSEETIERVEEEEERDYHVVLEGAWSVKDVDTVDDAVSVAVSEAGRALTEAGLEYVDVEVGATLCPACGEPFESAFSAAGTALVGIILELDVFNATSEEHAGRIAKSTVGKALSGVPLEVIEAVPTEQG